MKYPKYYDLVPKIVLYDSLSDFLGALDDGIISISYLDVVKYAGHSCPTVAGAYLMSYLAIQEFSGNKKLINRGDIKIYAKGPKDEGTNGVIANVAAYVCGINDESGFAGIGGKMSRKNKLFYDNTLRCDLKFEYQGNVIEMSYNPSSIRPDKNMIPLLQKIIKGIASENETKTFKILWQNRVEKILLNRDNYDEIISIRLN